MERQERGHRLGVPRFTAFSVDCYNRSVLLRQQHQFRYILRYDAGPFDSYVRDRSSLAVLPLHITGPRLANSDQFVAARELKCLNGFEHRNRLTCHGIKREEISG
jgi:hypothetical protein